ncbi:MAG: hypothetical protein HY961_05065 [Ignavibacteriae bacterium]|nr:hypothetical protein [Ignavibacteriota bacterium]
MSKVIIAALMALTVFLGCSQETNPVDNGVRHHETIQSIASESTGPVTLPMFIALPNYNTVEGNVEVTQFVQASGGVINLRIRYAQDGETKASIAAMIRFQPGTLTEGQNITIRLDPVSLGFEFLPHGITFGEPALLTIDVDGLDLTNFAAGADLWYVENGQFTESYQAAKLKLDIPKRKLSAKEIALRHFSRYAFGRIDGE